MACDNTDGDISDRIKIIYSDINTNKVGLAYYEKYSVTDSFGNTGYAGRYVVVSEPNEQVKPVLYVDNINENYIVQVGTAYQGREVKAFDEKDGEISDHTINGDTVDPNVEGLYFVTYNVQDSDGLSANPLTLKVVVTDMNNPIDYIDPDLTLLGGHFISLNIGENYIEPGFQAIDNKDGDITESVIVDGYVNSYVPGIYLITYQVKDSTGNITIDHRYITVN